MIVLNIHKIGWNPSDHLPVSVKCTLELIDKNALAIIVSQDLLTTIGEQTVQRTRRINNKIVRWDLYETLVRNGLRLVMPDINELQQKPCLNTLDKAVNSFSNVLYNYACHMPISQYLHP